MLKNVALVVIAVIATLGVFFPKFNTQVSNTLGSVVSPEILSPFFSVDGVKHEYRRQALVVATTTPCSVRTPNASSTLLWANLQIRTASSTATTWTVANATTPYATTTLLAPAFSLGSGAQGTLATVASSTPNTPTILAPNTYVVWGMAGVYAPTSDKLLGTCQAEFLVY